MTRSVAWDLLNEKKREKDEGERAFSLEICVVFVSCYVHETIFPWFAVRGGSTISEILVLFDAKRDPSFLSRLFLFFSFVNLCAHARRTFPPPYIIIADKLLSFQDMQRDQYFFLFPFFFRSVFFFVSDSNVSREIARECDVRARRESYNKLLGAWRTEKRRKKNENVCERVGENLMEEWDWKVWKPRVLYMYINKYSYSP